MTLRIPDDGGEYPLPPSLGAMEIHRVDEGEFVVPMRRAEALWLSFGAPWWKPHVLKVGIGGIDAISGKTFSSQTLMTDPQDYVVVPNQPWLDGINAGDGFIRQFVAVPLGEGLTVEAQLTGTEEQGGLTLSMFAPRPGRFPEEPPAREMQSMGDMVVASPPPMGLGAAVACDRRSMRTSTASTRGSPNPFRPCTSTSLTRWPSRRSPVSPPRRQS